MDYFKEDGMEHQSKAGKLLGVALAVVALVFLGVGVFSPGSARAAYEYGWKQSDGTGSNGAGSTRNTYMRLVAPNTNNMRVIAIGHLNSNNTGTAARFALYQDGTDVNPTGATLVEDLGVINFTAGANSWQWFFLSTPWDMPPNTDVGIAFNNNGGSLRYQYTSGTTNFNVAGFYSGPTGVSYTTAFPSTYGTASTYNYTYSHHIVYVLYPTISTNPNQLNDLTAGYTITGDGFEAQDEFTDYVTNNQPYMSARATTSKVILTQNNNWASPGTTVNQTITAWSNTSITFTSSFGSLLSGSTVYLWVQNSDGEHNATGIPVTLASASAPETYAGTASATIASNTQINVTMPFTGDNNSNGTCTVEYNTSDSWPGTAAPCSPVSGSSPRTCNITGLTAGNTYYVRVTYNDPDTVVGNDVQLLGPFYMQLDLVTGTPIAVADSATQITVTVPFTGDSNGNSSTQVEYNTVNSWPGTVKCASITTTSPRVCVVNGLSPSTSYYFRITHTDSDGVTGTNPVVTTPVATSALPTTAPTVTLVTPGNWPTRSSQTALKQKVAVNVYNPNNVGLTVSTVTLNNGSSTGGWGTVNTTTDTYGPVLPTVSGTVITWTGPFNIPAREAVTFFCEMAVNVGVSSDSDYNMVATVNDGIFNQTASVPVRWTRRAYATGVYAYMGTEAQPVYCVGENTPLTSNTTYPFTVEYRVPANSNTNNRYDWTGPSSNTQPSNPGQILRVSIPAGWTNVTATATQGIWNGVTVSGNSTAGWTIYGAISPGSAMGPAVPGSCGDFVAPFNFSARSPSSLSMTTGYTFQIDFGETNHSLSIEDYSSSCTANSTGTNRAALDQRGGFMVMVEGGDIVPPANVTGLSAAPSDNTVSLEWTNPTTDQGGGTLTGFDGVLVVQTENAALNTSPTQNLVYSEGNSIGNGWVVYKGNGTSFVDGSPACDPNLMLNNGNTYHYTVFSFDAKNNYSSGTEVTSVPSDTTPPGPVTNVTVTPGDRKNTLSFTNPVDCDFAGITVRYSTAAFPQNRDGLDPISHLSDGTSLAGTKTGGTPGAVDTFVHNSLLNGNTYYYTIWANDDEVTPNYSGPASPATYSTPRDTEPPGQITDLMVVPGSETAFTLQLQWSAPADSGYDVSSGNASQYYLRYYDQPITDVNWSQTWDPGGEWLPQPIAVGSTQTYTITGLSPLHTYYFAMKTADEVNNMSVLSNTPTGTTLCNKQLTACDECHQMPPQDGLPGSHPRATGNIGKHELPIHAGAGSPEVCNVCHANGNVWRNNTTLYAYNHQNYHVDMNDPGMIGNLQERETHTGGTFVPYTAIVYKFQGYSTGVGYKQVTGYCTGTYCHGAGLSSPRWGIDNIVCGQYCHETPPATGKHVKHYHPGQHYVNFAPTGTLVSGYDLDDGSTGWSGSITMGDNGSDPNGTPKGNRDDRYRTYLESSNTQKTFVLPVGDWYITVCVGDSDQVLTGQTIKVSGDGGSTWYTLIDNFNCRPEKHFDKTVDFPFTVTNDGLGKSNNMILQIGNGTSTTRINYMIVNSTPEAPKTNNTILQNTATAYGFSCGKCHTNDSTQAGHTGHVNGAVIEGFRDAEIHFDANSFPKNPLGVYTSLFGNVSSALDGQGFRYTVGMQCVNLYCHGTTLHAGGSNNTPTWEGGYIDVNGASLCGACHEAGYADSTPLTNMSTATGSHYKHTNNKFAYRFDCYKCHNHTVGPKDSETGIIPIIDKTHHVNGEVDVVFDPNDNTMKLGHYTTTTMTCEEVYCHSNGLLQNNQPYWATQYASPVWGSGKKQCNYCHGTSTTDGHPDYANVTGINGSPNSHAQHRVANGIGCSMCHYDTTRDNGLTIYTTLQPALHVNGTRNVTFNKAIVGASAQFNAGTCTNTYCHGLSAPPKWGRSNVTCGTCHGDGYDNPNPGVGNHFVHNSGYYDNNTTMVNNNSSAASYDFSCRFCHYRRTHGGGMAIPGVQTAEVNFNTVDPGGAGGYNNTGAYYVTGGSTFTDPVSGWKYTNGRCVDTKCHQDGRGGQPNNTFFTWTSSQVGFEPGYNCDGCHGGKAGDKYQMSTGHHPKHVWSSVYRRNCHDCHYDTVFNTTIVNKNLHVNGGSGADVTMSPAFGGTFDGTACSNVFCHSNADPSTWNGADVSDYHVMIDWTSVQGTTCTTCHSNNYYPGGDPVVTARTAPQTLSFNHGAHLTNYASRIGCTNCHNETAASNTTLQPTIPSLHVNGKKNIYFYTSFFNMTGLSENGNGYWGAWQNSPVDGFCTVICHSDGNGGNPNRFPNWSTVSYGCGSCHGAKGTLTSGSHNTHVNVNNFGCGYCHANTSSSTTADNPTINATGYSTYHVNGAKDVALATGTWNSGPLTCSNTGGGCHGSGDSPPWGTVATCIDCHGVTSAEQDDFTYGNAVQATINTTEYTTSGHGRTTAYPYTGNAGANLACESCHSASVAHDTATNPFRLMSSATIKPSQPDTLCLSCHSAAAADHDYAHVLQGTWTWTPKCVDCHDPHGDTAGVSTTEYNGAMIQREVSYTASNTYGVPGTTEAVDFPANFARAQAGNFMNWSSFVWNSGANKGICRVCHTEASNTVFTRTVYSSHNSSQGVCTGCHPHTNGFRPSSCDACHGYPPNSTDNHHDNVGAVGEHDMHFVTLNIGCSNCHGHNGSGPNHNQTGALSGYTSVIPPANVTMDLSTAPGFHGMTAVYNGTPGSWSPNKTCSNVGCHYGQSKDWSCP
jgi:predicted CxxxxCH...CXXCH cytochrome family protein